MTLMLKPSQKFIKSLKMINWIKNLFTKKDPIHEYLAKSVDLVDLERRQRELMYKGKYWI